MLSWKRTSVGGHLGDVKEGEAMSDPAVLTFLFQVALSFCLLVAWTRKEALEGHGRLLQRREDPPDVGIQHSLEGKLVLALMPAGQGERMSEMGDRSGVCHQQGTVTTDKALVID
jgi:hypothetical protein